MTQHRTPFCHTWWGIAIQLLQTAVLFYFTYHIFSAH